MSEISQRLWSEFLPGEMPEGCTWEQFWYAREYLWSEEDKEMLTEKIKQNKKLFDITKSKRVKQFAQQQIIEAVGALNDAGL